MHALLAAALLFGVASPASAQIMPPPARYDHPYRGRLDVIRTEAALQAPVPSPESAVCRRLRPATGRPCRARPVRGRKAGFSDPLIEEKFVEFGRGTQSMSPALGELEEIVMEKELAHGNHPVLAMNVACSVVNSRDDANRKSSKNKSTGRIDGLVALAMAVGVTEKVVAKPFSFILTKTNSDDIPMARNGAFCQNGL
jgi:hypothetical protein